MTQRIPLSKPYFDEREAEAVRRVLAGGWVVQGPQVEAFEGEIAKLHKARHCIAASSGTAALHICYLALGIGPGDALFIPSFAWPSAAHMAVQVGARPVFVDVLPNTYNLDAQDLERRIEDCLRNAWGRPRAVVPVHEFGLAADLDKIRPIAARHSLLVIEDAACALGAAYHGKPVGTFGSLGVFSFHPRKSVTTGEGGAIVTNDSELAERCRAWRNHGQRISAGRREFVVPGLNYRLTEIQAAIGRVQLAKLPEVLAARRALAQRYIAELSHHPGISVPRDKPQHTWQTFMVVLGLATNRQNVIAAMSLDGFETGPGSVAGHLGNYFHGSPDLTISAHLHNHGLALPLYAGMNPNLVGQISAALCRHAP